MRLFSGSHCVDWMFENVSASRGIPFMSRTFLLVCFAVCVGLATNPPIAFAQENSVPSSPTTIELSADAGQDAANDMASASAFFEATDVLPAALARKVNAAIASALETTKAYPRVKTRTGSTHTYPVYARDGRTIEAWRMRSELFFETQELAALSELLGKLQGSLAIGQIQLSPSPETQSKAFDGAAIEALERFQARAALLAKTLGKNYRIVHLNIGHSAGRPPMLSMARSAAPMNLAESAPPLPMEAGETRVTVHVAGTIALVE
jgi:predicted secreted protein